MVLWGVFAVALAVALYWIVFIGIPPSPRKARPSWFVISLTALALVLILWSAYLDRPSYSYSTVGRTTAIAIAFDLSPSMLAIPDPVTHPDVKSRFERGKDRLQELFRELENRQFNILVSMIGFTKTAEVILGWESNSSQIREMLQYAISPDLFTNYGTSMEAAVDSLIRVYDTLPQNLKNTARKVAILVSDGEDTLRQSSVDYALEKLGSSPFQIVALQTGSLDTNEGVPQYGEIGEFLGFERMGGRLYTVPDVDNMTQVAAMSSPQGLYVRAESPDATERMLEFIQDYDANIVGNEEKLGVILTLFIVVALLYARLLR